MSRGVDDINAVVLVLNSGNFGCNSNTAFFFLVATIHNKILAHLGLVIAEGLRLL